MGQPVLERINADESLQVLLYVCLPLLLLLVVGLAFRALLRPRLVAIFPSFTLRINQVGPEDAFVTYSGSGIQTAFEANLGRGPRSGHRQISVQIPREMDNERAKSVVRDLALGLGDLRYDYLIFRKREPRQVTQEERHAAIDQLRQIGLDTEALVGQQGQVARLVARNGLHVPASELAMSLPKIQSLISKANGIEERIEVLESSIPHLLGNSS
jgi:hypothetical protein